MLEMGMLRPRGQIHSEWGAGLTASQGHYLEASLHWEKSREEISRRNSPCKGLAVGVVKREHAACPRARDVTWAPKATLCGRAVPGLHGTVHTGHSGRVAGSQQSSFEGLWWVFISIAGLTEAARLAAREGA